MGDDTVLVEQAACASKQPLGHHSNRREWLGQPPLPAGRIGVRRLIVRMRRWLAQRWELEARDEAETFGVHEQLWYEDHLGIVLEPRKDGVARCRRSHDAGIANGGVALCVPAGGLRVRWPRKAAGRASPPPPPRDPH